jgi:hypothetical protein
MNPQNFKIAMVNELGLAAYERPHNIMRQIKEWLIVTRSGQNGDLLSVSDAGGITTVPDRAPDDISPQNTMYGLLLRENSEKGAVFLLVRHLPVGTNVEGTFFPVDGYARIYSEDGVLMLEASGRHAHSRGERDGRDVLHDVPHPAPGDGMAWHFSAFRLPWSRETSS